MIEIVNNISKHVVVVVKSHTDKKKVKEYNFKKTDPKLAGKKLI